MPPTPNHQPQSLIMPRHNQCQALTHFTFFLTLYFNLFIFMYIIFFNIYFIFLTFMLILYLFIF